MRSIWNVHQLTTTKGLKTDTKNEPKDAPEKMLKVPTMLANAQEDP
jgi:hypothetical protein